MSASRAASLRRHRGFNLLWFGDTVSQFGTQVTLVAMPLIAVVTLRASTFEVGMLTAAETAAFLLIGLPAGAWVDRGRKRPVMITCDIARALLLVSVPVAGSLGILTLPQLYAVSFLAGIGTVFFDISYQSYLPFLVARDQLVEGNAKLQGSQSVAQVGGPALGGFLVGLFGAPTALLADAASFLVSAGSVAAIPQAEPAPEQPQVPNLRREIGEGLAFVLRHPILSRIAGCTATFNLFSGAISALSVPFLVRDLGLGATEIGLVFSGGAVGGVIGAVVASPLARRIGSARAIWIPMTVLSPFTLLQPLAEPDWRVVLFPIGFMLGWAGGVIYNVNQVSFRQALCPPHLLGRMNATIRFLVWGVLPLGGIAGGALGQALGNRSALWVVAIAQLASPLWLILSPLRHMRDVPQGSGPAPGTG